MEIWGILDFKCKGSKCNLQLFQSGFCQVTKIPQKKKKTSEWHNQSRYSFYCDVGLFSGVSSYIDRDWHSSAVNMLKEHAVNSLYRVSCIFHIRLLRAKYCSVFFNTIKKLSSWIFLSGKSLWFWPMFALLV